ncbi:MAG: hypothetical protein KJZ62_02355 [Fimbriimonadaceae bacterium]|nr:hypothetical protein [Fimbriimonadaceae bacterium]QOJ12742.1 MAG: hypothetical protein HRU74_12040 [Chthonomonadaceae bacterium]
MSYIPDPDDQFDTWQTQYATYLNANLVALGLTGLDVDVVALNAQRTDWQTKYPAHVAAQAAAQTARQAKDASRAAYEVIVRRLTGRLQSSASVDDSERAALGITVPDRIPTPVGAPTTRPVLQADTSQRLRITINFADEGTPTNRAKPAGVNGCEIWVKLGGPPPTDLSECHYLATDTRTPYVAVFDGSEANQTAHFIGRWMSTRNEPGPLSETVSATVPG